MHGCGLEWENVDCVFLMLKRGSNVCFGRVYELCVETMVKAEHLESCVENFAGISVNPNIF